MTNIECYAGSTEKKALNIFIQNHFQSIKLKSKNNKAPDFSKLRGPEWDFFMKKQLKLYSKNPFLKLIKKTPGS